MKKTYQWFCYFLVKRAREAGGLTDDVLIETARDCFMNLERADEDKEKAAALRKAQRLLRRPDIRLRIIDVYKRRGFSMVDAVDKHISHIKEGNYQALKDFFALMIPKERATVNVKNTNINVGGPEAVREEFTKMQPRVLSAKVEDAPS